MSPAFHIRTTGHPLRPTLNVDGHGPHHVGGRIDMDRVGEALVAAGRHGEAVELLLAALAAVLRQSREQERLLLQLRRRLRGTRSEKISPEQLALGATDLISSRGDEAAGELLDLTKGGANHVLECVGAASSMDLAIQVARPGGTAATWAYRMARPRRASM